MHRGNRWAIFSMPPPTLDTDRWVTATWPAAVGTVVSVQATGAVALAPPGSEGPGEFAVLKPDRLVYAPLGARGPAYRLPYVSQIPNV